MKRLLTLITILLALNMQAQTSIAAGLDVKLALFGTDNQWTRHDPTLNYSVRLEHVDDESWFLALGLEYANLEQDYLSYYMALGHEIPIKKLVRVRLIPRLRLGLISREHKPFDEFDTRKDPASVFSALDVGLRYRLSDKFSLELKGSLEHATDIEGRLFRYGAITYLIFTL